MAREPVTQPVLGPGGMARWAWRQLTSMRTALVLLMLLAVASVPGSIWPQRGVDPVRVRQYLDDNPGAGPWLDRLGFFDVYASPWFAAIYLLLMISLVGCIIPRSRQHWRALRAAPPQAPRRLERLPAHRSAVVAADPETVLAAARQLLRRRRYRVRAAEPERGAEVAAEGGYLRETGNLIFHVSLLAVIVFVAVGHLWGWRGEVILPEGETFTSTVARYDTLQPGPWVDENDLEPFSLTLDDLEVTFESDDQGAQFGAPRKFLATVSSTAAPGEAPQVQELAVNRPLQFSGTSVYLLGNGYAPVVTVQDAQGQVLYSQATPFLPQDNNYASTGAVKVPGADPQVGFYGAFLPTVRFDPELGPVSDFPGLVEPALLLGMYQSELYPQGRAQSVYTLDVAAMAPVVGEDGDVARLLIRPGETLDLPGGGTITMEDVVRWGGLAVRHDPGRVPVLVSAIVLLGALVAMLTVRRRRLYVRVGPLREATGEHTEVTVAGLAKGQDSSLEDVVERLLQDIRAAVGGPTTDDRKKDGR